MLLNTAFHLITLILTFDTTHAAPSPPTNPDPNNTTLTRPAGIPVIRHNELRLDAIGDHPPDRFDQSTLPSFLQHFQRVVSGTPGDFNEDCQCATSIARMEMEPVKEAPFYISNTAAAAVIETLKEMVREEPGYYCRVLKFTVWSVEGPTELLKGYLRKPAVVAEGEEEGEMGFIGGCTCRRGGVGGGIAVD